MKTNMDLHYTKYGRETVLIEKGAKVAGLFMSGRYYYVDASYFPKGSELERDAINQEFQVLLSQIDFEGEDPEEMIRRARTCTQEEYLCAHGAGPDWGDAGNHSPRAHISGRANRAISKRMIEQDQALFIRRAELRVQYKKELEAGTIREPTATEQRIKTARGHPDNAATMAARRLLEKRGIEWRPEEEIP